MTETTLLGLLKSGGWIMWPILFCSMTALAIIVERLWFLRISNIIPPKMISKVWVWINNNQLDNRRLKEIKTSSALGRIFATGLVNSKHGRVIMKESIEESASHEVHKMERYLNTLGSLAAIAPLLGLLGTVLGMIEVFSVIVLQGTGNATVLAGGISEALVTTASGLSVAIPALFFHRFFTRRIEEITVIIEQEAIKLIDVVQGHREIDSSAKK